SKMAPLDVQNNLQTLKRQQLRARRRWRMLYDVIRGKRCSINEVSVRRFTTFGLLHTAKIRSYNNADVDSTISTKTNTVTSILKDINSNGLKSEIIKPDTNGKEPDADTNGKESDADTNGKESDADTNGKESEADTNGKESDADTNGKESDTDTNGKESDVSSGNTAESKTEDFCWFRYTASVAGGQSQFDIRQLTKAPDIEDILGFNNTGNVCVWPSEEVLTYYLLKHKEKFSQKTVCELGGGMTCLAGVAVAIATDASKVLLTDGNEQSADNVQEIITRNVKQFCDTEVHSSILRWDRRQSVGDLEGKFDYVICADCFFFDEYREDLVHTIYSCLKPKGEAIMFAPTRGATFQSFMDLCKDKFTMTRTENYDDTVWKLHQRYKSKGEEIYDENLHYPVMLHLIKKEEL
ncbi:unnamed protein product, partial [Owenia fusiformis]